MYPFFYNEQEKKSTHTQINFLKKSEKSKQIKKNTGAGFP